MAKKIVNAVAKKVLWLAALALCRTYRIKKYNSSLFEKFQKDKARSVIAFWHGSMLVGWFLHRPQHGVPAAALVSQSEDGEILSATLARWGYAMIRGSSHVGGKEAMQLMVDAILGGNSLCMTPDGPTGPRHQMKMGAVRAAQRACVPLFLVGIAADRKKILKSWDGFEIPGPFSNVGVWYSDPIMVPENLQDKPLDIFLTETQAQLVELNMKAEQVL
jgi:lysophospholipid acyltransferase (LPLAT)-like uncharacterized protein